MKYRKKPVVVEAFRPFVDDMPDWFADKVAKGQITINANETCDIQTLEGTMHGSRGDYMIMGVNGEIYPCKPDIFNKTYELATE